MLFLPTPRKDKKFVLFFFTGNGEWGKKKTRKGDLKDGENEAVVVKSWKTMGWHFS